MICTECGERETPEKYPHATMCDKCLAGILALAFEPSAWWERIKNG